MPSDHNEVTYLSKILNLYRSTGSNAFGSPCLTCICSKYLLYKSAGSKTNGSLVNVYLLKIHCL